MKIYSSCEAALGACAANGRFAVAHLYGDEKTEGIHTHDCYELYYSVSGARQFLIDNRRYRVEPGDAFFINQFESHCITQVDNAAHERILLLIAPDYLCSISTADTDLDACFREHPPGSSHCAPLDSEEQKRFLFYIDNLKSIAGPGLPHYGIDIIERSMFALLMVYMTKRYLKYQTVGQGRLHIPEPASCGVQVDGILSYINQNLAQPLSLEQIAARFHLSTSYVCRIFKSATGTTINQYITAKRIVQAKYLLTKGYSVTSVAERCGFGDYSNFFRAFTKATNISPKKYAQFSTHRELTGS